jgi:stage V sporulation protein R
LIHEFFTEDFCRKQEYFYWKHYPNGEYRLESRDYKKIKQMLMRKHINGGLPDIKLTEPNYSGRGAMMLQHEYDGRPLYDPYIGDVLSSIRYIWNNDVVLATQDKTGKEKFYLASGNNSVQLLDRQQLKRLF